MSEQTSHLPEWPVPTGWVAVVPGGVVRKWSADTQVEPEASHSMTAEAGAAWVSLTVAGVPDDSPPKKPRSVRFASDSTLPPESTALAQFFGD